MKAELQVNSYRQGMIFKKVGLTGSLLHHIGGRLVLRRTKDSVPAFSVAELGQMMPDEYDGYKLQFHWTDDAYGEGRRLYFSSIMSVEQLAGFETEADLRAEILIAMLESGQTTVDECIKRLK